MGRMISAEGMSVTEALDRVPRRLTGWAVSRSLGSSSVAGISLALGVCAAVWFSAGTRADNIKGALALCVGYLASCVARSLAGPAAGRVAEPGLAGVGLAGTATLAEMCGALSEYAVYAGLAVGGYAAHWANTWLVAAAVMMVLAVRGTVNACGGRNAGSWSGRSLPGRAIWVLVTMPPGWRIAVIVVAAPIWGAHTTLLVLLDWGIIATGYAIAAHRSGRSAASDGSAREDPAALADSPVAVDLPVSAFRVASPALASPALASPAGGAVPAEMPLALAATAEPTMTLDQMIHVDRARPREPKPKAALDPQALAAIAVCRDDGVAAVWLGQLVRGQFVPLPPAIAGLAAACLLAVLGMQNLLGLLLLTPLVVMLLAAFGSSHPHDGRVDWLVPAVMLAGQFVYVTALGFAFRVPAPVTFALCALIALRYLDLAIRPRPETWQAPDTRLGWEGRMLAIGMGAMLGLPTLAYLALTAYLGVLICGKVMTSYFAAGWGRQ